MRTLSFKLLGPLTVEVDGDPLPLGGPRQRTVLATLLLFAGAPVPVDVLIDTVWGGRRPVTARNQIAVCINALRRIFRAEAGDEQLIVTGHRSYALVLGRHGVDLDVLGRLVSRARKFAADEEYGEAAECFRQALALWNGTAFEGLSGGVLEIERARLTDLWLDVSEENADLLLRLGQHRPVASQMAPLVEEWPLREQARLHLMTALRRSGRRAKALEIYRAGRKVFIEEIGAEPGPALQELHQSILAELAGAERPRSGAPAAPPAPPAPPAQLPAPAAAFTGRDEEIAALDRLLDADRGDVPLAVAAISGTSGVGKTALAVSWGNRVARHFPDGQLFVDMRGHDGHESPVTPMRALDRCLRALGVRNEDIPDDLDGRSALYRSVLDGKRMLVLLDDVRSVAQALPLIPGEGRSCVVLTGRDSFELLAGDYAAMKLALQPLPPEQSGRMLAAVAGHVYTGAAPEQAAKLVELCGGLPLALRIVGASLIARPYGSVERVVSRLEDRRRRLDVLSPYEGGVRGGMWSSYRELSPETARLFRLLGLLPVEDFTAWAGAALLDVCPEHAEDLLEQLVQAQLLDVRPGAPGTPPRFALHSLLRLFAWERSADEEGPEDRRAALGRAFRAWLVLADRAHEQLRGRGHAAGLQEESGYRSPRWLPVEEPWSDPMAWLESERQAVTDLIGHWREVGSEGRPWELVVRLVPLFETHSHLDAWRAVARTALRAARASGDSEGVGAMLSSLGTVEIYQRNFPQARALLLEAVFVLESGGDARTQATVLRNLALCARFSGDLDEAGVLCRQAVDCFKQAEDDTGRSHALGLLAQIELERGENRLGIALIREAIAAGESSSSPRVEAQNLYRLAEALLSEGEAQEAGQLGHEVVLLSRAEADRLGEAHGLRVCGEAQWRQGRPDEAVMSLERALAAATEVGDAFVQARIRLDLACAAAVRGARGEARTNAESALAVLRGLSSPHWEERAERLYRFLGWMKPGGPVLPAELVRLLDRRVLPDGGAEQRHGTPGGGR
ncbi:BTAD domain-containing putative transcriptional regulator [Streptomyces sp. NPDC101490]|uniref:AfsR/SARP family transcriptional regulator n=1 Tax=Streptomyces sp. NPDC101490 TaxID=3366143 RepID=UPI0037FF4422